MSRHDAEQQRKWLEENGCKRKGTTVAVHKKRNGDVDIEGAIRELKKRVNREGITKELRKHEFYETKGERRRRAKAEAIRRYRKQLFEEEQPPQEN